MSKRFTDTGKWRNPWFRALPVKAKLVWIYICDECDFAGAWKMDLELASFQLGFEIRVQDLIGWFGPKIYFMKPTELLVIPFFGFQYGSSKDSWNAKAQARQRLEALGFSVIDNETQAPQSPDSPPTVGGESLALLSKGTGKGTGKGNTGDARGALPELAQIWNEHCGELAKVRGTNKERNKRIKERWAEASREEWVTVVKCIAASDFCNGIGKGSTGWRADFDWLLQPEVRLKVMEGKYDNREGAQSPAGGLEQAGAIADRLLAALKLPAGPEVAEKLGEADFEIWKRVGGRPYLGQLRDGQFGRKELIGKIRDALASLGVPA